MHIQILKAATVSVLKAIIHAVMVGIVFGQEVIVKRVVAEMNAGGIHFVPLAAGVAVLGLAKSVFVILVIFAALMVLVLAAIKHALYLTPAIVIVIIQLRLLFFTRGLFMVIRIFAVTGIIAALAGLHALTLLILFRGHQCCILLRSAVIMEFAGISQGAAVLWRLAIMLLLRLLRREMLTG